MKRNLHIVRDAGKSASSVELCTMLHVLTPQGSRAIDRHCIDTGISAAELMATASANAAAEIRSMLHGRQTILVACGGGNNGGYGFAIALDLAGEHDVTIVSDANPDLMSPEAASYARQARTGARWLSWEEMSADVSYTVVIDAVIGVGGSSHLRDPLPSRLRLLNQLSGMHIAIDVPTGVDALTGTVHADAFRADVTITMAGPKSGFYSAVAQRCIGIVKVVPIGAPDDIVRQHAVAHILERTDVRRLLPQRPQHSSKFDYGHVVVIGGSRAMRGAAALTAEAALRAGAGLCVLATPSVHPLTPREVMTAVVPSTADGWMSAEARPMLERELSRATVVALGPGLGRDGAMQRMLAEVINGLDPSIPLIIDADGLRIVPLLQRDLSRVLLTPHEGEYQWLVSALQYDWSSPHPQPAEVAAAMGCVIHRKGVPSVTTMGAQSIWTAHGNPGMATAGSGDVLTGIIAGLAAQGVTPYRAAALGSFLHAEAGDRAAAATSEEYLIAGDIIRSLGEAWAACSL